MADNNVEAMLHHQWQTTLTRVLDSAVQAGDINAARDATRQLSELAIAQSKKVTPQFTSADIRAALKVKAPWFGVDPRRSAKAVEFGKNMEPQSFKSADEFADELIRSVDEEFETVTEKSDDDEDNKSEKIARKRTDAPSGDTARAIPRRSSGPWTKLSDAPKETADQIKHSADKFTRNATKEQRQKYIETALATAYAADQRVRIKK